MFLKGIINLFFGVKYIEVVIVLRILVLGFMFYVVMGFNVMSLVVVGRILDNLIGNFFVVFLNVVFNMVFILVYGINGVVLVMVFLYIVVNLYRVLIFYRMIGV